jgi:hypothetical protein
MKEVVDIHHALKTAALFLLAPVAVFVLQLGLLAGFDMLPKWLPLWPLLILPAAFLYFPIRVFMNIAEGIQYNEETEELEIPGSNTDMSILDIITFKTFRQLLTRESLPLHEIQGLNNHVVHSNGEWYSMTHWILIVSGDFGSRQIRFASKAKRDEARVMLRRLVREVEQDVQYDQSEYD